MSAFWRVSLLSMVSVTDGKETALLVFGSARVRSIRNSVSVWAFYRAACNADTV